MRCGGAGEGGAWGSGAGARVRERTIVAFSVLGGVMKGHEGRCGMNWIGARRGGMANDVAWAVCMAVLMWCDVDRHGWRG
ncbi:MAG: hypothetical protein ACTSUE_11910 [Promethearchaeota archaeon]